MQKSSKLILSITMLSIFIILLVAGMIYLLVGKVRWIPRWNFSWATKVSKSIVLDETYQDEFQNILIEQQLGDVEIKQSTNNQIRIVVYGKEEHAVIKKEKDLTIKYQEEKCKFFCISKEQSKIEVYLPSDYQKEVKIENKYGDIKIDHFISANFKIDANCGDVFLKEAKKAFIQNDYGDIEVGKVGQLNIKASYGDVEIREVANLDLENNYGDVEIGRVTKALNIKEDCGDISIDHADLKENSKITNSYGDVSIDQLGDVYVDAKTSFGDINIDKNNRTSNTILKIENSCGDIEVES